MALKCAPVAVPELPLFPGQRQRWLLTLRIAEQHQADPSKVAAAVRGLFQAWLPLFPGPIGEPEVVAPEDSPTSSVAQPPALDRRGPNMVVGVEFDYDGSDSSMFWPTFVSRRRERIDPLCPMSPVDSMPIAVGEPERASEGADPLEPRENPNEDPLDLGLGPVDSGTFRLALGGTALLVGVGVGVVLLFASRKTRF